jgi:hypothetical protein
VSLSTPNAHHGVLLFAMLLIFLLLWIEARCYRFFDVYRSRVRIFERYYFAPIFAPVVGETVNWRQMLVESLRDPQFRISYTDAFSRRLRRNYIWDVPDPVTGMGAENLDAGASGAWQQRSGSVFVGPYGQRRPGSGARVARDSWRGGLLSLAAARLSPPG